MTLGMMVCGGVGGGDVGGGDVSMLMMCGVREQLMNGVGS